MIIKKLIIIFSFLLISCFNTVQILWTIIFSSSLLVDWSVLPLPLSELFIGWMLPECFSLRILPSIYQSGNFQAKTTRISQHGSCVFLYALVNAAWNVVRNNATFKAYYNAKKAKGRSHYNALGHCASKLIRVIWKILLLTKLNLTSNKRSVYQYQ